MPTRAEMTARALKPWLRHVAIYERVSEARSQPRYRVRLMGSAYQEVFGDLTGQFLDEVLPPEAVPLWHAVLDVVLAGGRPTRFLTRSEITGKDYLISEYCSVPLANDAGESAYVMGVGYYEAGSWDDVAQAFAKLAAA